MKLAKTVLAPYIRLVSIMMDLSNFMAHKRNNKQQYENTTIGSEVAPISVAAPVVKTEILIDRLRHANGKPRAAKKW